MSGLRVIRDEHGDPTLVGVLTRHLGWVWRGPSRRTPAEEIDQLIRQPPVVNHGRQRRAVVRASRLRKGAYSTNVRLHAGFNAGGAAVDDGDSASNFDKYGRARWPRLDAASWVRTAWLADEGWTVFSVSTERPVGRPRVRMSAFGLSVLRERITERLDSFTNSCTNSCTFDEAVAALGPGRPSRARQEVRAALKIALVGLYRDAAGRPHPLGPLAAPSAKAVAHVLGCSRKTIWELRGDGEEETDAPPWSWAAAHNSGPRGHGAISSSSAKTVTDTLLRGEGRPKCARRAISRATREADALLPIASALREAPNRTAEAGALGRRPARRPHGVSLRRKETLR